MKAEGDLRSYLGSRPDIDISDKVSRVSSIKGKPLEVKAGLPMRIVLISKEISKEDN